MVQSTAARDVCILTGKEILSQRNACLIVEFQLGMSKAYSPLHLKKKNPMIKASCSASAYCRGKWDIIQAQIRHFSRRKVDLWATFCALETYFEVERRLTSGHCLLINDPFLPSTSISVLPQQAESFFLFRVAPGLATEWTPHLLQTPATPLRGHPAITEACVIRAAVPDLYRVHSLSPTTFANPVRSGVNDSRKQCPRSLERCL